MTALQNYSTIIDSIFGAGTTTFDTSKNIRNNVTGALNYKKDYKRFKANFIARLKRLKQIYSTHPAYLKEIIVQVNLIADNSNWEGAFAELATYDFFNQDILKRKTYIYNPIKPNVTLPNTASFAKECGKLETNLDGFVEDRPLYFDVKCFKDNVLEILDGIYKELKRHLGTNDIHITAEHALDMSYDDLKSKRKQLLEELKTNITTTNKKTYYQSTVLKSIGYRILWGAGVTVAERTYSPFSHAKNYHKTVFNYANKLMKNEHTVIVLVVFPWYNNIVSKFRDSNIALYRALSRRVFCQYKHDPALFSTFNSAFKGNQTIYEISNHLSGIVFLEDQTILSSKSDNVNVESFVYLNPNSIKPLTRSIAEDFLRTLKNSAYDDFRDDNY